MNKLTLFDITSEMRTLLEALADSQPVSATIPGEADAETVAIEKRVADLLVKQADKIDAYGAVMSEFDVSIAACETAITGIAHHRDRLEKKKERLLNFLKFAMDVNAIVTLEGHLFKARIQANPPTVIVRNEEDVPAEFKSIKQEVVLDKKAILNSWKAGKPVAGTEIIQKERVVLK